MSMIMKDVLLIGGSMAGATAFVVAGTSDLIHEPRRRAGEEFSTLFKFEVGAAAAALLATAYTGARAAGQTSSAAHFASKGYAGLAAEAATAATSFRRGAFVFGGLAAGIVGGRLLVDAGIPSLRLAND